MRVHGDVVQLLYIYVFADKSLYILPKISFIEVEQRQEAKKRQMGIFASLVWSNYGETLWKQCDKTADVYLGTNN